MFIGDRLTTNSRKLRNGCVFWTGGRSGKYGSIRIGRHTQLVHRVAYWVWVGAIPNGLLVCHKCDHPLCINPKHLFIGTQKDNISDMMEKGRSAKGEHHSQAKLTTNDVRSIKRLLSLGYTGKSIAARFDVDATCVYKITRGERWTHIK